MADIASKPKTRLLSYARARTQYGTKSDGSHTIVHGLRCAIGKFWLRYSALFSQYWENLSVEERKACILEVCPSGVPDRRGSSSGMNSKGKKTSLCGVAMLNPEFNMKDLAEDPKALLKQFSLRAPQADQAVEALSSDILLVEGDHADIECVQKLVAQKNLVIKRPLDAVVLVGERAGETFAFLQPQMMRPMLENGGMMQLDVYNAVRQRQLSILMLLSCVADNWMVDVLSEMALVPDCERDHCHHCGKGAEESAKLQICGKCRWARYCSKECADAEWKVHRPFCEARKMYRRRTKMPEEEEKVNEERPSGSEPREFADARKVVGAMKESPMLAGMAKAMGSLAVAEG